jgi:hypothetical protein
MEVPLKLVNAVNRWRKEVSSAKGNPWLDIHGGYLHDLGSFVYNSAAMILSSAQVPFGSSHHWMYKLRVQTGGLEDYLASSLPEVMRQKLFIGKR